MNKILIIEDDKMIAESVKAHLNTWGYEAFVVKNFNDVLMDVTKLNPDLILLDIGLPFYNGFYWCKKIRENFKMPIIFLSSASDNMNIVMAMDMGADDFISKPFDLNVLTAKIRAMIRRSYSYTGQMNALNHGGVIFNLMDDTVSFKEDKCNLSKTEAIIMTMLMENAGSIVSRDMIMTQLWDGGDFIDDNTLTVNITRIRKKLKDIGVENFIKTRKGIGYIIE